MTHQVETMAYTNEAPWHQLGNALPPKQPLSVWAEKAGMDWRIEESPVYFDTQELKAQTTIEPYHSQKVLFRSDTHKPLSVVSNRYHVVQPQEVLEFYRDLTEYAGYKLETAGVLKGGKKFWALARTGLHTLLKGIDAVEGYVLLATSCDGTMATTATPTTVRVVCNNTLAMALKQAKHGGSKVVKVPHNTKFDPQQVKRQMGIHPSQWDAFMYRMKALTECKVKRHVAMHYFLEVLCKDHNHPDKGLRNHRALKRVQQIYDGHGLGSELSTAKGTAWGLLNAVTQYVDHDKRARSPAHRLDSAWFGQGAALKQRALDHALELVR